jgi:hypothetical protein
VKIRVEVKNDILGDSVLWEGDSKNISQIRNIPARELAEQVARDGVSRKIGIWIVTASE